MTRDQLAAAFVALRDAEAAHDAPHDDGRSEVLGDALTALERELRDAAHALEVAHWADGRPLDRLAAQVVSDATAGTLEARLRMRAMSAGDWHRADPVRLPLMAVAHALELGEYVQALEAEA